MKINKLLSGDKPLSMAGKWIWAADHELSLDTYVRLRGSFTLDKLPARATLTIANTCGEYELWINGQWAGRSICPSTPEVHFADEHSVKKFLRTGRNVVCILAHGYGSGGQWWSFSPSGLVAELRAGRQLIAASDDSWRASLAPEFSRRAHRFLFFLGFAEIVDLRDEQPAWLGPDFDDSAWPAAGLCKELGHHAVIPREIPLPNTATFPARPAGAGKWLFPQGVQSIYLPPIVKRHGPGKYRLTTFIMSPGVDFKLQILCDSDYSLKLNGTEAAHRFGLEASTLDRYTEQDYHPGKYDMLSPPASLRLEPGWNEVQVEIDADDRSAYIALDFHGTSWCTHPLPVVCSATRQLAEQCWRVEKADGSAGEIVHADKPTAEAHSVFDICLPFRDAKPPKKDVLILPGQYAVFDLGRVMSGRPGIEATAPAGTVLDLQHAEWMSDYDKVVQAAGDRYTDRITCREGRQRRELIARRGVRFIKISNRGSWEGTGGGPATVHAVWNAVEKVVGKPRGSFQCSDDRLNAIYTTCIDTMDVSLNYHPVDCPTRENGQYPGDAFVQAHQLFYLFDDLRLLRKGIRQFPRVQEENGRFPGMAPAEWRHTLTDYAMIWVSWIAEHYRHTADANLVREMLPYAEKLFGFFRGLKDQQHGLVQRASEDWYWAFLDHSPIHKRGLICGYNAWYARALEDASWLAAEVGQTGLAQSCASEARQVREACRNLFWDADAGLYRDCFDHGTLSPSITFQTNVIALYTGLATVEQAASMPQRMWRPDGSKIQPELNTMNPYFQHYVLDALAKVQKFDWGLCFIRDYWGLMLDCGATTAWECFQSTAPVVPTASQCHPWSAAPAYWLPAYVLGVKCAAPGWRKAIVRPQATAGIDAARGTVPTPLGAIKVEWQRKGGTIDLKCDAPAGIEIIR